MYIVIVFLRCCFLKRGGDWRGQGTSGPPRQTVPSTQERSRARYRHEGGEAPGYVVQYVVLVVCSKRW